MSELLYATVHEDLLDAFPELALPYQRLVDDWDNFGGEPPGQYKVFSDTYGTMLKVTLTLADDVPGRKVRLPPPSARWGAARAMHHLLAPG